MKRFYLLIIVMILALSGFGQSTANYAFATVATGSLTDMSSGTTVFSGVTGYNTASTVTPIGFTFYFMGIPYTQFSVNASGKIQIGATAIGTTTFAPLANTALLGPIGVNNEVKLPNGKVQYKLTGSSPNQILIVEWVDLSIPAATTGTYSRIQVLLYEATGKIEYVYGTMYNNSTAAANSIFISSGTAANQIGCVANIITSPTYVTTGITNTTFAATSAITNLNSSADGSRRVFSFTPTAAQITGAPTWAATPIDQATSAGMRLNWNDNSTNETGFAIFRSLDDITYTYVATAAANATSYVASGLTPSTLYYWKVYATNEGSGLSTATSNSMSTVAHGNITSITSGNWNSVATWSSGGIPAAGDNVTIANGNTVALDAAGTCYNLNIGNGTNGILEMKGFTLTVIADMTIAAGSTTRMNATVSTAGNISVAGNLTNNGTLDLYASATNYGKITFTGATNTAFTLNTGSITNLDAGASRGVLLTKGTTATPILDFIYNGGTFTVQSVSNPTVGCFYLINGSTGTLRISGTTAFSFPVFGTANYTIPDKAGFWLNNPNFVVTAMAGSATIGGIVRITSGTFNVGNATGNNMSAGTAAVFTFEGGTTNIAGYFNGGTTAPLTISGGVINITTVGNGVAVPGFNFTAPLNITGGTINLVQKNTNAAGDYNLAGTITSLTGMTLNIGTSATAASSVFGIKGILPTIIIDNTTNTKTVNLLAASTFNGLVTVTTGSTLNLNGFAATLLSNITNNGSITGTVVGSILNFQGTSAQSYGGTPTSNQIPALTLNNAAGLTITPSTQINTTLTLTTGALSTNGTLTLGNGGTTAFALVNSGGSVTGTTAFNLGTGANTFTYNGTSAQTTGPELPSTASVGTFIINNAAGVTLNSATSLPKLTLTTGVLTTSTTKLLTVTSTTNSDIARTTGYINGPLVRRLPISATTGFYLWPLGKSAYTPFEIVLPTISVGTVDIKAEVFDTNSGGTAGSGMSALNTDRYWSSSIIAGASNFSNSLVRVTDATAPSASKALASSATQTGIYNTVGSSINGSTISSNTLNSLGYFALGDKSTFAGGTFDVGNDQPVLKKLTDVANQLNNATLTGNVIYELNSTYDGTNGEIFPITFNQLAYSGGTYTVTIRVKSGAGPRTLSTSSNYTSMINLNGADNVIFDGREGGVGNTSAWTMTNTSGGSMIMLSNGSTSNKIQYCNLKGASTNIVTLSTTNTATGNSNNTIDHCNIGSMDAVNCPNIGIASTGTSGIGLENNGNVVTNNNFFDFRGGTTPSGVNLGTYNTDWEISDNNFYQTTAYAGVAGTAYGIYVGSGNNYLIRNNFIGGSTPTCGGTAWTINGTPAAIAFIGICVAVGNTTATSVQNNTIANFNWTSTIGTAANTPGAWGGIALYSGSANIGTLNGNVIGNGTGTGSVTVTSSISGAITSGIFVRYLTTGAFSISNNTIGSITTLGSSTSISHNFYGIYNNMGAATSALIDRNTIGSTNTTNSINASTASTVATAQVVMGIYNGTSAATNVTTSNNTIANLNNNYVPTTALANTTPIICGIYNNSTCAFTVTNNIVRNLSTAANATGTGLGASVIGIALGYSNAGASISQNTIYGLSNSNTSANVAVSGIHYAGPTSGTNLIDRNTIYGLSIASSSLTSDLRGINFASGLANIQNNVIRLGYDATETALTSGNPMTGLYLVANTAGTGVYFNSVSVGGTGVNTIAGNTYAFRGDQLTNTRTIQDNIFFNGRSNATTGGKHYAIRVAGTSANPAGLTLNYNDYFVNGTGGVFGYFNSLDVPDFATWKTNVGQDLNSININPLFTSATNLTLQSGSNAIGTGTSVSGIAIDNIGATRNGSPTIGAFESTCFNPTSGGTIAADQTGCAPFTPAQINSTALPSGNSGSLEYKWQMSTTSNSAGFADVATSNAINYTPGVLTQTTWFKRLSRTTCMSTWTGAAESNAVAMTINSALPVSVVIAPSINPVCTGTQVTFTATPTNGGTTPSYQWKVNGNNVGTSAPTYTYTPTNNDVVTCVLTSNVSCPTGNPATSNAVTMNVNTSLPVSITIAPSSNPACSGTSVTFTATPVNGGTTPTYQWKVNGNVVGTSSPTYSYIPTNNDNVTCILTSNIPCPTGNPATSNTVAMTVIPTLPVSVSIGATSNNVCQGTPVTLTATPTNGGATPVYQWIKNRVNVGTNSTTYTYTPLNKDTVTCLMTSDATCTTGNPATSNLIIMTVNPILLVSVSVSPSANPTCAGSQVVFTAVPVNGGTTPTYQWKKGGVDITGETGPTYTTSTLATNDIISVVMTSNATPCASGSPATSNPLTMTVLPTKPVSVSIQATANSVTQNSAITICDGTSVTFTSGGMNFGSAPAYQWMKNGTPITGATSWFYTTTSLAINDVITLQITSNVTPCATGNPAISNPITVTVNPILPVSVSIAPTANPVCAGATVTLTATPTNGGTTPTYQWKVNNNNAGNNNPVFNYTPSNGDVIICVMTSNALCTTGSPATSNAVTMVVDPLVASVSIVASDNQVCPGTSITYTATPVGGGAAPTYQWKVNGSNVGSGINTYTYTPGNGDIVQVAMTSGSACVAPGAVNSNLITMVVTSIANVSIAANANPVCAGALVTFTATPVSGGGTPGYKWYKNNVHQAAFDDDNMYWDTFSNGNTVKVVMTSSLACAAANPVTSNIVTVSVGSYVDPGVTVTATSPIVADWMTLCGSTPVTFTAHPTNGGSTPFYQWYNHSVAIAGATNSTYTYTPVDFDAITVDMTSSLQCTNVAIVSSTNINIEVIATPSTPVSVSIIASNNPSCAGSSVLFTANPTNGGTSPSYQWAVNGVNAGTNSTTFNYVPSNNDVVTCNMISNVTPCTLANPVISNPITMVITPAANVTIVASANPVCAGTSVTLTPTPVSGGTSPAYQWYKNTVATVTTSTYTYVPANGDVVYVTMTSNDPCSTGPVTSGSITMVVDPVVAASVSIVASDNNVCAGTAITYTATPVNGGTAPTYLWYKNSVAFASGNPYIDTNPTNGDVVYVVMTSDIACTSGNPATSNSITMVVPALPTISLTASTPIVADNITVCAGTSVTFTPHPIGGGNVPTYDWYVNYNYVSSASTYTYIPADGDVVFVDLTSSINCTGGQAISTQVWMVVDQPVAAAGAISGTTVFTPGTIGIPYSVGAITNATSYTWAYSGTGVTINGTGTNVTLNFAGGATPGTLTVKGTNSCGDGLASTLGLTTSSKLLNIKVYLEGPYAGAGVMNTTLKTNSLIPLAHPYSGVPWNVAAAPASSIPAGVVDWVLVELRDAATPAAALSATTLTGWPKAYFLKSDGSIVDLDGTSLPNIGNPTITGNLYIIVRHRNHLAIMSATGATLNTGVYSYDFTTALTQVYGGGTGYKQVATGVFGMVVGDIDHDGRITVGDYNIWASQFGTLGTYQGSDLNMNSNAAIDDYNKWAVNFGNATIDPTKLKSAEVNPIYFSCVPK